MRNMIVNRMSCQEVDDTLSGEPCVFSHAFMGCVVAVRLATWKSNVTGARALTALIDHAYKLPFPNSDRNSAI